MVTGSSSRSCSNSQRNNQPYRAEEGRGGGVLVSPSLAPASCALAWVPSPGPLTNITGGFYSEECRAQHLNNFAKEFRHVLGLQRGTAWQTQAQKTELLQQTQPYTCDESCACITSSSVRAQDSESGLLLRSLIKFYYKGKGTLSAYGLLQIPIMVT